MSVGLLEIASVINMNYSWGKGNCKNIPVKINSDTHLLKPAIIRSFLNSFFFLTYEIHFWSNTVLKVGCCPDLSQADTFCILTCSIPSLFRVIAVLRLDVRIQELFWWGKPCFPIPLNPGLESPLISQLRRAGEAATPKEKMLPYSGAVAGSSGEARRPFLAEAEHYCSADWWYHALFCVPGTTVPHFQAIYFYICV